MPKKSKPSKSQQPKPEVKDYEQFLIEKIHKCQRIVDSLANNPAWEEIKQDFELSAKSLDLSWAYADPMSPQFKQMQATKMAVHSFLNLRQSYEHDLKLAKKELDVFRNPKIVVKKDYDDEGVEKAQTFSNTTELKADAYHGDSDGR